MNLGQNLCLDHFYVRFSKCYDTQVSDTGPSWPSCCCVCIGFHIVTFAGMHWFHWKFAEGYIIVKYRSRDRKIRVIIGTDSVLFFIFHIKWLALKAGHTSDSRNSSLTKKKPKCRRTCIMHTNLCHLVNACRNQHFWHVTQADTDQSWHICAAWFRSSLFMYKVRYKFHYIID